MFGTSEFVSLLVFLGAGDPSKVLDSDSVVYLAGFFKIFNCCGSLFFLVVAYKKEFFCSPSLFREWQE